MFSFFFFNYSSVFAEFPTNRTELNAVFDIFDRDGSGEIDYREFVDALRPERQVSALFPLYFKLYIMSFYRHRKILALH